MKSTTLMQIASASLIAIALTGCQNWPEKKWDTNRSRMQNAPVASRQEAVQARVNYDWVGIAERLRNAGGQVSEDRGMLKVVTPGDAFDSAKGTTNGSAKGLLDAVAIEIRQNVGVGAKIIGHTDDKGSVASNRRLSQERAAHVKRQLVQRGVAPNRLWIVAEGELRPISNNETANGRANNRRVEIMLWPMQEEIKMVRPQMTDNVQRYNNNEVYMGKKGWLEEGNELFGTPKP